MIEAILGGIAGALFGTTQVVVGHPFDTIKTKMQAQTKYMDSRSSYRSTVMKVIKNEGLFGLYRGCGINVAGVVVTRSFAQATFEMFYTMWDGHSQMSKKIPNSNGLEYRTLGSGMIAGSMRTIIECPYEYVKVKL